MRLKEKIEELETYTHELAEIKPVSAEVYNSDLKTKAACERYFEKIVESLVDCSFLVIKEMRLLMPEDDKQAFDVLSTAGVISAELATRLKEAKGMRNILAHEYGQVDNEIVFTAITEELEEDVAAFVSSIKKVATGL